MITKISEIESMISFRTPEWKGQCWGVAKLCIDKNVVQGKLRYGHYRGPVSKDSMFYNSSKTGFVQHGWVDLLDGRVFDPTRWVFENVEPYIYVGSNEDYDVGGNKVRMMLRLPPPVFNPDKRQIVVSDDILSKLFHDLLGDGRKDNTFSIEQIHWIAISDPNELGPHVKLIYRFLQDSGQMSLVPLDNWELIME